MHVVQSLLIDSDLSAFSMHNSDAESVIEELCYAPFGIKEHTVTPDGGIFSLGSSDASLEVPQGAVMKKTLIRYAIILDGPFELQSGYRRVSVVVYLNLNRATLLQPVFLNLSDWCEKRDIKEPYGQYLQFFRASHEIKGVKKEYEFSPLPNADHQSEDVLRINEPKCYYMKVLREGRRVHELYCAVPIQKLEITANRLLIRILFIWNSDSWRQVCPTLNFIMTLYVCMCTTRYVY